MPLKRFISLTTFFIILTHPLPLSFHIKSSSEYHQQDSGIIFKYPGLFIRRCMHGSPIHLKGRCKRVFVCECRNGEREEREKKREREDEKKDSSFTKSKKQDCDGQCKYSLEDGESNMENNTSSSSAAAASCEECLGLGVFDFPWLHGEGMVSSSEELNIEDTFSSSLQPNCNNPWYEHEYESSPLGIGEERERERERERKRYYLEEALREGTEDGSESIWSSVLSQPLV